MKYKTVITPSETSSGLVDSIKSVRGISLEALYVDVMAFPGCRENDCFANVEMVAKARGGKRVLGWAIWELPQVYGEAEFHAVWQDPKGNLYDVNPRQYPAKRVLFLEDPSAIYEGRRVDNIRIAISEKAGVRNFLDACRDEFELINQGDRAGIHGMVTLKASEAKKLRAIHARMIKFAKVIVDVTPHMETESPCACGCGKPGKACN